MFQKLGPKLFLDCYILGFDQFYFMKKYSHSCKFYEVTSFVHLRGGGSQVLIGQVADVNGHFLPINTCLHISIHCILKPLQMHV